MVSAISELLCDSYYPQSASGKPAGHLQIRKCLQLIGEDEGAAVAFYGCLHEHVSVGSAAKMSVMLLALIGKDLRFLSSKGIVDYVGKPVAGGRSKRTRPVASTGDVSPTVMTPRDTTHP